MSAERTWRDALLQHLRCIGRSARKRNKGSERGRGASETERARETERETKREIERERERDKERDREREIEKERERQRERERDKQRERDRETDRDKGREKMGRKLEWLVSFQFPTKKTPKHVPSVRLSQSTTTKEASASRFPVGLAKPRSSPNETGKGCSGCSRPGRTRTWRNLVGFVSSFLRILGFPMKAPKPAPGRAGLPVEGAGVVAIQATVPPCRALCAQRKPWGPKECLEIRSQ